MVMHRDTKESQVFELVQAKGGHKLKEYVEEPAEDGRCEEGRTWRRAEAPARRGDGKGHRRIQYGEFRIARDADGSLVRELANYIGKPVTDATGLTGKYNVKMTFSRERLEGGRRGGPMEMAAGGTTPSDGATSLFKAVQEQLGLKLEQKKGTVELIVIDKAEKTPTAN
jgi:uncharacterized protein (TIGR03435 family)